MVSRAGAPSPPPPPASAGSPSPADPRARSTSSNQASLRKRVTADGLSPSTVLAGTNGGRAMGQVSLIAKMTAKEGRRDELVDILRKVVDAVQQEEGTLVYAMNVST